VIKTGHSVSAVITANKGNDIANANKTKQVEPLSYTIHLAVSVRTK
jgi:hypothetical protein